MPTRRTALARGSAALLTAARRAVPLLFAGCSMPNSSSARPLTVALLHSQTGPIAISATPVRDAQIHALEQINAGGGLLGRSIEIVAPDPRSRTDLFAKRARRML
ncbi:MAG: transporter substrate-binding protein, partial [Planctomycetaceae bacterium]